MSNKHAVQEIKITRKPFLFHDDEGVTYAKIRVGDHEEIWPLKSRVFRSWLANAYYQRFGKIPSPQDLQEALNVLQAEALFEREQFPVFTRVGHWGEKLYVFLANQQWHAIEIDANGWRNVSDPQVFFLKPRGMVSLPEPLSSSSIEELRRYVNVLDENDWVLLISWLLAAFHCFSNHI